MSSGVAGTPDSAGMTVAHLVGSRWAGMHHPLETDAGCTPRHRGCTHPDGPIQGRHTLDTTVAAQAWHSDTHQFAGIAPLCCEAAFAAAGRCLERGRSSTPAGVSSLRVPVTALPHALPRVAARETRERCRCHKSQHSTGVARRNPIPGCPSARHVGGPTFRRRAVAT